MREVSEFVSWVDFADCTSGWCESGRVCLGHISERSITHHSRYICGCTSLRDVIQRARKGWLFGKEAMVVR